MRRSCWPAPQTPPSTAAWLKWFAKSPGWKMPTRRAAAEALTRLDTAVAGPRLAELVDECGDEKSVAVYTPELHAELLRGLALHMDPARCTFISPRQFRRA